MNGIKLTEKEWKRMAKDMGQTVEEMKEYISILEKNNLINIKNNVLTLPVRR